MVLKGEKYAWFALSHSGPGDHYGPMGTEMGERGAVTAARNSLARSGHCRGAGQALKRGSVPTPGTCVLLVPQLLTPPSTLTSLAKHEVKDSRQPPVFRQTCLRACLLWEPVCRPADREVSHTVPRHFFPDR